MILNSLLTLDPVGILSGLAACAFILLVALPIHELAHALIAKKLGDPTAQNMGRITLNPLAHLDPVGAVCIALIGFGWAKPVPINARYFQHPKRDMALSALAGPVSNILMAFILLGIYIMLIPDTVNTYIDNFFFYAIFINLYLAVFNLIPMPPLDGSHILKAFLSPRLYYAFSKYEQYFFLVVMLLLFTGILGTPLRMLSEGLYLLLSLPFAFLSGIL